MASIITFNDTKGRKRYKVTYELPRSDGQRHRKSKTFPAGTKLSEVKSFKREKETELEKGELMVNANISFSKYVEEVYFPIYATELSPTTRVRYMCLYESKKEYCVKNRLGDYKLNKITHPMLQQYTNELATVVSPKTVREFVFWLRAVYNTAISGGIINPNFNPTNNLKLPRNNKPDTDAFTKEELFTLLEVSKDDRLNQLVIGLAGLAGLRRGEIMGLLWENVDLTPGCEIIHIVQSRVYTGGEIYTKEPKTTAGNRDIPIPKPLVDILQKEQTRYKMNKLKYGKDFNDSGYVVVRENGTPCRPGSVSDHYTCFIKRMERERGIKYRSMHKLRHTYATLLIDVGVNPKVVQRNLGHEDITTTLNVYAHAYEARQKAAADKLTEMFDSLSIAAV